MLLLLWLFFYFNSQFFRYNLRTFHITVSGKEGDGVSTGLIESIRVAVYASVDIFDVFPGIR